jgi:glutamate racemase
MDTRPVLFIDSGIGGIPYCRHFHRRNPGQHIVYLADRLHFPYGKWEKDKLAEVLITLVEQAIVAINPKIVVIACNTASIAALSSLREHFPALPFVGTVPAVKPAALATKTGKIGVLGTELTIQQPYIRELADQYGKSENEIIGIAAPELVEFVEEYLDFAIPEEKEEIARYYLNQFRAKGADTVVLGCTHFLFLDEEFRQAAIPDITIFESIEGISQRIESLLAETIPRGNTDAPSLLMLTGSAVPEPSWFERANRLGFGLSLLGEE